MKIQSINNFERININKKQSDIQTSEIVAKTSLPTPETMQAFKAYAVASPNFKNLSMPIEVTDKYNKKVEGKAHLDLPNIHVYEYPDTNLRVIVNNIKENQLPQVLMYTELEPENYDSLKQALLNQIMFSNFKKHNLENYYNFDLHSKTQMISTDSENPLNISDLKKFSSILTNAEINEDNLEVAKEDLINYIQTPEYKEKTQFANSLYKNELIGEDEFKQKLNFIKLEDIKNYYKTSLENSEMGITLSINKQNQEVMNILSDINKGINNKFKGNLRNKNILLNDEINYVYTKGNIPESKLYYTVDDTNLINDTIIKIISKLENKYSKEKQEKENDYINKKLDLMNLTSVDREIYFDAYKKREEEADFLTSAGNLYLKGIDEPLTPNSKNRNLYVNFYTVFLKNDNIAIESKVQKQQEFFKELLDRNLKDDIEQIKNNYKSYIKYNLLENESTSIRNLNLANLETDVFQIYETVDSITEQDVKNYIETYFVNQAPVVEVVEKGNENINGINFKGGNLLTSKKIINKTKISIIDKTFAKPSLPIVSTPILLYMKTKSEKIASKLIKESNNTSNKTFTTNYEKSVEDLKDAGVKGNYNKYIDSTTGRPNIGGQNKIDATKKQSEISHKGASDDMHNDPYIGDDNAPNEPTGFFSKIGAKVKKIFGISDEPESQLQNDNPIEIDEEARLSEDLKWIDNIDETMCPECEEIYNRIPDEVPEGLMNDIMGEIPEGFAVDEKLLKMLRNITKDLLGDS